MASSTVVSRLSSRLRPMALKLTKPTLSFDVPLLKSVSQSPVSASARRISRSSRLPVELSCLESMMPLHSAIASARLTSSLSIESKCWGLTPQGISMPL
ncbi:Protein NUCLEAR FUSION DEFECTIVE 6 like [Actinidia chinensis var. chinensis]|uniref:Protein NUCLEAR FUSION DEFECTIVE 6 like n=1 Tax=Actinidia chinensis var. chinensis TaxID=1590841 RepID=A0A2R6Q4W2_ACTCC|nr:Protein NUCLEAR FUSION DEFECTIVE 6 like [Actinidia chinensis var. chinensis]